MFVRRPRWWMLLRIVSNECGIGLNSRPSYMSVFSPFASPPVCQSRKAGRQAGRHAGRQPAGRPAGQAESVHSLSLSGGKLCADPAQRIVWPLVWLEA